MSVSILTFPIKVETILVIAGYYKFTYMTSSNLSSELRTKKEIISLLKRRSMRRLNPKLCTENSKLTMLIKIKTFR